MTDRFEDWAAPYLDGELTAEQTDLFEQALFRAEVALDLREELLLRELLVTLPPIQPPDELVVDIEFAMMSRLGRAKPKTERFSNLRTALRSMGWMVRGPQMALSGSTLGTREALHGLSTLRYSMGPLVETTIRTTGEVTNLEDATTKQKKARTSLWRRLLRRRP